MRHLSLAVLVCSASMCWAEEPADTGVLAAPMHLDSAADLEQVALWLAALDELHRAGELAP